MTPTMKKLLHAVERGEVVRNVTLTRTRTGSEYKFGWSGPVGERTINEAEKLGFVSFEGPTQKLDNPFVAAGGVGGKLSLTQRGQDVLSGVQKTGPTAVV